MYQKSTLVAAIVGFLTLLTSTTFGQPGDVEPQIQLPIRIYDYAGASESAISLMKTELQWILAKSGASITWLNCRGTDHSERQRPCGAALDSSDLILRIVPTAASEALPQLDQNALGFTAAKATSGGKLVTVSLKGAEALAGLRIASLGKILAYVAAHEIGHVFLGSGHRARSIMAPVFRSAELEQMKMRQLVFSPDQAEGLRSAMRKRIEEGLASAVELRR